MTNNKEQISTFMDNELDQADLDALLTDQYSQETWENFHMIGDTLRGETALVPQEFNIAANIAAALNDEPAHSINNDQVSSLIESQPEPNKIRRQLPSWLSNFVQISTAACVTLVVILGMQQFSDTSSNESQNSLPVLQTVPLAGIAEPVSLTNETIQSRQDQVSQAESSKEQETEKYRKINALMQDYELQRRLNSSR